MHALSFRNFISKDYFTQLIIIQDLETYLTKAVSPLFSALLPEVHAKDCYWGENDYIAFDEYYNEPIGRSFGNCEIPFVTS